MENVPASVIDAFMAIEAKNVPHQLARLRNRAGLSMAAMARATGYKTASGYQTYEKPERAKFIPYPLAEKIAAVIVGRGEPPISRQEVLELAGNLPVIEALPPQLTNISIAGTNMAPYGARDLPILGHGRAGDDRYYFENGAAAQAFTYRPMELLNIRDAYAVYVHGASMSPRFKHGELAYVDPHRPVGPGDDVVVQMNDGQGYIKELVRRTDRLIRCKQYNPVCEVDYPTADVRSIHLIISATRVRV